MQAQGSLYDRLGGIHNIATVCEDLVDRLLNDQRLLANPKVAEARERVPAAGIRYLVSEMVAWAAAGGPQNYTGRSMAESHDYLQITEDEWRAFMDDAQQSLDKFGVPPAEANELKGILESTKSEIVTA